MNVLILPKQQMLLKFFFSKINIFCNFFPNIMMAAILLLMNGVTNILLALLNKQNKCLIINQKIIAIQTRKVIYMWLLLSLVEFFWLTWTNTWAWWTEIKWIIILHLRHIQVQSLQKGYLLIKSYYYLDILPNVFR